MKILIWLFVAALTIAAVVYKLRHTPVVNDMLVRIGLMELVYELPKRRTLTDSEGRSIDTEVIGFTGSAVAFKRMSDNQKFVIDFDKLSEADREFFAGMDPQNGYFVEDIRNNEEALRADAERAARRNARLAGRHATWHRDIQMAKRDAQTTDLPVCLLFLRSDGDLSDQLDRFVVRSDDFRKWANTNVVLCLYYHDPDQNYRSTTLNSATKEEARSLAKLYSLGSRTPAFVVLNPDGTVRGKLYGYGGQAASVVIDQLKKILAGKASRGDMSF